MVKKTWSVIKWFLPTGKQLRKLTFLTVFNFHAEPKPLSSRRSYQDESTYFLKLCKINSINGSRGCVIICLSFLNIGKTKPFYFYLSYFDSFLRSSLGGKTRGEPENSCNIIVKVGFDLFLPPLWRRRSGAGYRVGGQIVLINPQWRFHPR